MSDHIHLPGVACPCGSAELRVVAVGNDGDMLPLGIVIERPAADRGWCSVECARLAGWPWVDGERADRRALRVRAPEAGSAGDVPCRVVSSLNSGAAA